MDKKPGGPRRPMGPRTYEQRYPSDDTFTQEQLLKIREAHDHEQEQEHLRVTVVEALKEQYQPVYIAYSEVVRRIAGLNHDDLSLEHGLPLREVSIPTQVLPDKDILTEDQLKEVLDAKLGEWEENGTIDYLVRESVEKGIKHTIVATPVANLTQEQVVELFKQFGEAQLYPTYVDDIYKDDIMDADALCPKASIGSHGVAISLVPSKTDQELDLKTTDAQSTILKSRLTDSPHLKHHVPTLLEILTYWEALRAGGDQLVGDGVYEETLFRLFEHTKLGSGAVVPFVFVGRGGEPCLTNSVSGDDFNGRLLIG